MITHPFILLLTTGIACATVTPEAKLSELESVIQAQFKVYESLKNRISELEEKVASLKSKREVDKLDQQTVLQKDDLTNGGVHLREFQYLKATEHISKRQNYPSVAFHAYMNNDHCYTTGNRLVFDVVPVDVGGGLVRDHSTYDVPAAGIYVLTWTVAVPRQSSKMVSELVVNNIAVEGVTISDPDNTYPGTGSGVHPSTGVAIVQLQQSDHVFVRVKQYNGLCATDLNVIGDDRMVRTTFSGWRI